MKDRVREWAQERNNGVPMYIGGIPNLEALNRELTNIAPIAPNRGFKVYPTPQGEVPVIFRYGARRQ